MDIYTQMNKEIMQYLDKKEKVYYNEFDETNCMVTTLNVVYMIPREKLMISPSNLKQGLSTLKDLFEEVTSTGKSYFKAIEAIGRDHFFANNRGYKVKNFGKLKGLSFANSVLASSRGANWLLVKDNKDTPLVLFIVEGVWKLEKVGLD